MASRHPRRRGGPESQVTWRALLAATYFNIPASRCPTCRSGRECGNYFCVECRVGGLCSARFQDGGDHAHHLCIKVWKVTGTCAVREDDLRTYMTSALVDRIQKYSENGHLHCKFFKPKFPENAAIKPESSKRRLCHGCSCSISATSTTNQSDSPMCSLECLLAHALEQRVWFLIAAIDSMQGGWDLLPAGANSQ